MPVDNHPTHPRTQIDESFRHGCHNRQPFASGYWAPDRAYLPSGEFIDTQRFIPHVNTTTCQNDIRATDQKCAGCKHIEDGK